MHLIPEWAHQFAVLIAWPHPSGSFRPWLEEAERTYAAIAEAVTQRESIIIVCRDERHRLSIAARLVARRLEPPKIGFIEADYDDIWVRDTAPLSVALDKDVRLLNFRFNGWGGKYRYAADERLAEVVHAAGALGAKPMERVDFVLEGGSVESDGTGTLLTTSRCLLNPNRNPGMSQERIEALLLTKLGADRVLWLDYGYAEGDDTDAHVDTLARFCSPDTIAYTTCDRTDDPLYGEFAAMAEQLRSFKTRSGVAYRLIPLPIPGPIYAEDGQRLPATYANFLIINGAVLLPVYNDPKDKVAMEQLALCFPGRAIVAIDCRVLIRQFGSLHCMTMQFPESSEDG